MKPHAYYNEIDPYAALWIENLILEGVIAYGDVDRRSIEDVRPNELVGYTQCHFFAGLGGWSYALRLAGWPDERPVWTGSCPCQPFSAAGKGEGFADERHLWPAWYHLIREHRPGVIFGEQVASPAGLNWFVLVHSDLEATEHSTAAVDICAAGIGAPHIRQRLYWVADSSSSKRLEVLGEQQTRRQRAAVERSGAAGLLGNSGGGGSGRDGGAVSGAEAESGSEWLAVGSVADVAQSAGADGGLADDGGEGWLEVGAESGGRDQGSGSQGLDERSAHGSIVDYANCDWLPCRDGKWRPVEPGTFPLAHGVPARVGRLRAYGNAIHAILASQFIGAYLET